MSAPNTSRAPEGLRLGVNIDHVATLRQVRGTPYPSVLEAARACLRAGADGITVHLREDRRHIQDEDVRLLRAEPGLRLNLEMATAPDVLAVAREVGPDEACLVPERRAERTTEGGLDAAGNVETLRPVISALRERGVAVSLFIEPEARQIETAAELGVPMIELHTGRYSERAPAERAVEARRLSEAARRAHRLGLQVNAGHGLTAENVAGLFDVPHLHTLNIGHSIVCRAIFIGLESAVREMIGALRGYAGGRP
jgi:pyridoxine 5-phosphate synthase